MSTQPASAASIVTTIETPKRVNRLPSSVQPRHYAVELTPDLKARTFTGVSAIDLRLTAATSQILLNTVELEVQSAHIQIGERKITHTSIELNDKDEICTFTFGEEIPTGDCKMHITFTGRLNDDLRGFYASTHIDENGVEQTIATTQFEATDCRRAMPCVDEPAAKATFAVTIVCPSELTCLSNMPVKSSAPNGVLTRHVFETTPIMSTYLLAFVVGKLDVIEAKTAEGTTVRCFTTPGKSEQGRFALDIAVKLLPFYNKWFDEPYPLPLLQMVALPDFAAGAMENWGLITYRETALLLDPVNSSAQTRQWVAVVVAHEIAHQWFGNLVTMEWWTHLWLNEGFATWMQNHAVDYLFPEWRMWDQFVDSDLNSAFDLDSLANSHPIEVPIYHASETDEIFDTISYCKGCVVIRQLAAFLGEDHFRAGLVKYIKKFAYKNALTEDLWSTLSGVSGKDVAGMMAAWTKETGFPLLQIEDEGTVAADGKLTLKVKQARFMQTGPDASNGTIWPVPIDFLLAGQKDVSAPVGGQVFKAAAGTITVDLKSAGLEAAPKWMKLNAAQATMYRVQYPPKMFAALCEAVKSRDPLLTAADRLGVQNDAFALTRCGLLSTVQLLELVQSYENEDDYTVFADLCGNLGECALLVESDEATYELFCVYVQRLLSKIVAKVGWQKQAGEDHTTSLLRAKVIGAAAKYQDPATQQRALELFAKSYAEGSAEESALAPDLRSAVYGVVVSRGGALGYECMRHHGSKSTLSEEKNRCLQALAQAREPALIERTLASTITSEVRTQDGPSLIAAIADNRHGAELCWSFCQKNWSEILKKYQQSSSLSRIVGQVGNFTSKQRKTEVEAFFASHEHPGAERAVKQAIERIESNAQWIERDGAAAKQWLQANVKKA